MLWFSPAGRPECLKRLPYRSNARGQYACGLTLALSNLPRMFAARSKVLTKTRMMREKKAFEALLPWLYFLTILLLVEVVVRGLDVPSYLLPTPSAVVREFAQKATVILPHLWITLTEAALGFVLGNVS